MDDAKALWQLEELFWLESSDFYAAMLAPDAFMVLPQPAGVLDRSATITAVSSGDRWLQVMFEDQHVVCAGPAAAVLVYLARADRGTPSSGYVAQCTSTYVRNDRQWLLAVHHQTPIGQTNGGRG